MPFLNFDVEVGYCVACEEAVTRINPKTGATEWLNGEFPLTEEVGTLPGWKRGSLDDEDT